MKTLLCVKKFGSLKSDIGEMMIKLTKFWPTFGKAFINLKSLQTYFIEKNYEKNYSETLTIKCLYWSLF